MLYLNRYGSDITVNLLNLTLTNVVFEWEKRTKLDTFFGYLTLTNVVFESTWSELIDTVNADLTLTRVVFEYYI